MPSAASWSTFPLGVIVRQVKDDAEPATSGLTRYVAGQHMDTDQLQIARWGEIGSGYLGPAFHRRFRPGHVLYGSRRTYLRKVAVADFEGICANTTLVLESADHERLLPSLLPFVLQTEAFHAYSIGRSRGSVNPYINWSDVITFEIRLPPLSEQQRIADFLWSLEASRRATVAARDSLNVLRQALLRKAFRDQSNSNSVQFGDVGEWLSGGTPSRSIPDLWSGPIPWVSPKDMKVATITDASEHISRQAADSLRLAPEGSTLFVTRGMILAHSFPVAIAAAPVAFNQDMKAVVPGAALRPRFLYLWLVANAERCGRLVTDSTHGTKRLPTEVLQKLRVPIPSLELQDVVVQRLDRCDHAISAVDEQLEATKRLHSSLLNSLLPSSDPAT